MKKDKKVFSFLDVSIIVIASSFIMCFLGATLVYKHLGGVNYSLIRDDNNLQTFIRAYNDLLDNYYGTLDQKELISGAIEGMYSKTDDPYTTYLDTNNSNTLDESLNGHYEGVGIVITESEDHTKVLHQVVHDSPAEKAGLQIGDVITKLNGEDVREKEGEYITEQINSLKKVKMTVERNGVEIEVELTVEKLNKPVVYSKIIEENGKKVGYMSLSTFNDTSDTQVATHLSDLERLGIDALILDLRSNSGGYLQMAKNIAEMFLEKGKIIYGLDGKSGKSTTYDETNEKRSYPINILVNGGTASASEILAGALRYSYGAEVIGTKTYGKGKVQEKSDLKDGTSIKYTTAKWLMPNGECLDEVGLSPDIEVEYSQTNDQYSDTQIMSAVKNLVK